MVVADMTRSISIVQESARKPSRAAACDHGSDQNISCDSPQRQLVSSILRSTNTLSLAFRMNIECRQDCRRRTRTKLLACFATDWFRRVRVGVLVDNRTTAVQGVSGGTHSYW
jgi:hypothetical protein